MKVIPFPRRPPPGGLAVFLQGRLESLLAILRMGAPAEDLVPELEHLIALIRGTLTEGVRRG